MLSIIATTLHIPFSLTHFDRHPHPLMPGYHRACYHCICRTHSSTSVACSVCSKQWGLWSVQQSDTFSCLPALHRLHEYYTCLVNSQEITWLFRLKRHRDGCEMLERHCRTKCWPTPSITHAEQMTQFSLPLSPAGEFISAAQNI